MLQVGQRALAEDDVVCAGPRQGFDRRMRLEEPLRILVRVERPAPAQVELQEAGESTFVQQGRDVGCIADEMRQMKNLWVPINSSKKKRALGDSFKGRVEQKLTCKSVQDKRAVRKGRTYFLSQGMPVNTADLRLGSSQTSWRVCRRDAFGTLQMCLPGYPQSFPRLQDREISKTSILSFPRKGYSQEIERGCQVIPETTVRCYQIRGF